jgi:hypothetical protein
MAAYDDALVELMAAPLAEFTARRQALSRQIKEAGDRDLAARVQAIKKPSATIWTANQVARYDPEAVELLMVTAAEMERQQQAVLAGARVDPAEMRSASAAFQQALDRVVQRAGRMPQAKISETARRELRDLLAAAAAGPEEGRVALRGAHLTQQPPPMGFGGAGFGSPGHPTAPLSSSVPAGSRSGRSLPAPPSSSVPSGSPIGAPSLPSRTRTEQRVAEKRAADLVAARDKARKADDAAKQAEGYAARLEAEAGRAEEDAHRLRREADAARRRADQKRLDAERAAKRAG